MVRTAAPHGATLLRIWKLGVTDQSLVTIGLIIKSLGTPLSDVLRPISFPINVDQRNVKEAYLQKLQADLFVFLVSSSAECRAG